MAIAHSPFVTIYAIYVRLAVVYEYEYISCFMLKSILHWNRVLLFVCCWLFFSVRFHLLTLIRRRAALDTLLSKKKNQQFYVIVPHFYFIFGSCFVSTINNNIHFDGVFLFFGVTSEIGTIWQDGIICLVFRCRAYGIDMY